MSQFRHWAFVYFFIPLVLVMGEYGIKLIIGWSKYNPYSAFPFPSLLVSLIFVALFVREELENHVILNPEAIDDDERAGCKAMMIGYAFALIMIFGATVAVDVLVDIQKFVLFEIPAFLTKILALAAAIAFVSQVVSIQQRFKLRPH